MLAEGEQEGVALGAEAAGERGIEDFYLVGDEIKGDLDLSLLPAIGDGKEAVLVIAESYALNVAVGRIGNSEGIEWRQLVDEVTGLFVDLHAFVQNGPLCIVQKRRFAAEVHAAEQGVDHAGRDLILGKFRAGN